jgi:sec-independent protein translocase protein TatC
MPDSSNGAPRPDDNKEPSSSPEISGLPRIAPPEGIRSARGLNFDDVVPTENEAPTIAPTDVESVEDETFSNDASIDSTAYFPQEELAVEPPLGIDTTEDEVESPSLQAAKAAEAERYRVSSLRDDTPRDKEIGLMEHLRELRVRLLWCFAAVILGMCLTWTYNQQLQAWFAEPIITVLKKSPPKGTDIPNQMVGKDPMGFFSISFQFSLVSALILVMPFIFFQAWRFIEPALTNSERRYTLVLVPFSSVLFFMGAALGFYVSPLFFKFFIQFQPYGVAAMWDYYESLLIMAKMLIVFGAGFQVPIVVIFGIKIGILTREILIQYWRHAVVVIFIASAVLTPTWDPVTLAVCALPSCLLYALSIWIAKWI